MLLEMYLSPCNCRCFICIKGDQLTLHRPRIIILNIPKCILLFSGITLNIPRYAGRFSKQTSFQINLGLGAPLPLIEYTQASSRSIIIFYLYMKLFPNERHVGVYTVFGSVRTSWWDISTLLWLVIFRRKTFQINLVSDTPLPSAGIRVHHTIFSKVPRILRIFKRKYFQTNLGLSRPHCLWKRRQKQFWKAFKSEN